VPNNVSPLSQKT